VSRFLNSPLARVELSIIFALPMLMHSGVILWLEHLLPQSYTLGSMWRKWEPFQLTVCKAPCSQPQLPVTKKGSFYSESIP
jgi:hypothetical protein